MHWDAFHKKDRGTMGVNEAPCLDGLQQKIQKKSDQFAPRD